MSTGEHDAVAKSDGSQLLQLSHNLVDGHAAYAELQRLQLPLCPDTLEYIQTEDALLCCSYFLDKASRVKTGAIDLIQVNPSKLASSEVGEASATSAFETKFNAADKAVFDARWNRLGKFVPRRLCAVATSAASVHVDVLQHEDSTSGVHAAMRLDRLASIQLSDDEPASALYVDWLQQGREGLASPCDRLVASRSDGHLNVLRLTENGGLDVELEWSGHNLGGCPIEVWTAVACPWQPEVVWSGGDDSKLKGWDIRTGCSRPTFTSSEHTMGVTIVSWNPHVENTVCSGSYDECVLLWDQRQLRKPIAEFGTGGGVWRLKWYPDPEHPNLLLAACMYNGVHVLSVDNVSASSAAPPDAAGRGSVGHAAGTGTGATTIRSLLHYQEHKSIAYGIEWLIKDNDENAAVGRPLIASCSFYDQDVHLWQPSAPLW